MMRNLKTITGVMAAIVIVACSKQKEEMSKPPAQSERVEAVQLPGVGDKKKSIVISEAGQIDSAVKRFQSLLGPLSLNEAQRNGRREINWDDVVLFMTNNNNFPGDYYHRTDAGAPYSRKTGALFTTRGSGFRVSNNNFSDIDSSYLDEFVPFSPSRNFTTLGSNILDIHFKVPGTTRTGYVEGFGVVLSDVNVEGSTWVSLYSGHHFLGTYKVKVADTGQFSFIGVYLPHKKITRARIKLGEEPIGKKDICDSPEGADLVVLDNVIFSNPRRF